MALNMNAPGNNPSQHPAHEFPLADRIVDGLIGDYIVTACELALAANGYDGDKAAGYVQAVEDLRYRTLAGWDYRLTPKILDALRRAGLLARPAEPTQKGADR